MSWKRLLSAVGITTLTSVFFVPAIGAVALDASGTRLDFSDTNVGADYQYLIEGGAAPGDVGKRALPGTSVVYESVAVIDGVTINAAVTYLAQANLQADSTTLCDSRLNEIDDDDDDPYDNQHLKVESYVNLACNDEGTSSGYGIVRVDFIDAANNEAVSIENLSLNVYDVDQLQFVELVGFSEFTLSTGSIITPIDQGQGRWAFTSTSTATSSNNGTAKTLGRVKVKYPAASSIDLYFGASITGSADFDFDFGSGLEWIDDVTGATEDSAVQVPSNQYEISYNANGGINAPSATVATGSVDNSLEASAKGSMSRVDHEFAGWNSRPDGSGQDIQPGGVLDLTSNITLYAQWELIAQAEYGVDYFISPPMVQGSYLLGEVGTYSVDFNSGTPGDPCPAKAAGGKILFSGACSLNAGGQYGGAITTSTSREVNQSPSVYASTVSDEDPLIDKRVIVDFTEDMNYLGFWWSAGSAGNNVTFLDGDSVVLELTTQQLFDLFGDAPEGGVANYGSTGNLTVDSVDYPKHYYFGHPRGYSSTSPTDWAVTGQTPAAQTEPFVYVHVFTKNSTSFNRVELTGAGFEFDNFVISSVDQTPDASRLSLVSSISPSVTFDANGGTGTMTDQTSSIEAALDANSFEFDGFVFDGWNTESDGTGSSYADEGLFPFSLETTLYAQWKKPGSSFSSPSPYQGPVITDVGADNTVSPFPTSVGNNVRVLGLNLAGVSSVLVNGIEAELVSTSENSFVFTVPEGLDSGTYDLTVVSTGQNIQVQEPLVIGEGLSVEEAAAICDGQAPTVWTQRISVTQAKAYIKCGTPGVSYRVSVQQNGSGPYDTVITRTLTDIYDDRQLFNSVGRYVVRTIDLTERTRIRIYSGDEKLWQVVYNKDSFGG